MTAITFDKSLEIQQLPYPDRKPKDAIVRVTMTGICNTDLEITKGYVPGFSGVLGHEFIGIVQEAKDITLIGKRCTAEINFGCGVCNYCTNGLERHCPHRSVLGIINQQGCFADYVSVPEKSLVHIPDEISNRRAIFIEPLAAALEILDQVTITKRTKVLLLGDGKLGLLIGYMLASTGCNLTVVGKHRHKLNYLVATSARIVQRDSFAEDIYDVVVEATGNSSALTMAMNCIKPRGTIVLKSTYAQDMQFNPSQLVVNEVSLIGSRCGQFSKAIDFLLHNNIPLEDMIDGEFSLAQGIEAFEFSSRPKTIKTILVP